MLWGVLYRTKRLLTGWDKVRWVPGAHEICFEGHPAKGLFLSLGKTVSCKRGEGIYQPCMEFCVTELDNYTPIHLFVEGKVNETRELLRIKWGVGRLAMDSCRPPVIIPWVHRGMENVLPLHHTVPKIGNKISVEIGKPLDTAPLLEECKRFKFSTLATRKYISDTVEWELRKLGQIIDQRH
eukprot:sb/3471615/